MVLSLLKSLFRRPQNTLLMGSPAANDLVRAKMAEQGDDGTRERKVSHFVYPVNAEKPAPRVHAVELLSELGFTVSDSNFRNGIIAEHEAIIAVEAFDTLTEGLRVELAEMGYEYDGWECVIYKEGTGI